MFKHSTFKQATASKTKKHKSGQQATNIFDGEQENTVFNQKSSSIGSNNKDNIFSRALEQARAGQSFSSLSNESALEREKQKRNKELLKRKLHERVNPIGTEVYSFRQIQVEKRINNVRKELKEFAVTIKKFHKTVDIVTNQQIVNPGLTGSYHLNFLEKLRSWIALLTQSVKSATTWLQRSQTYQKKKKNKRRALARRKRGAKTGAEVSTAVHNKLRNKESSLKKTGH